MISNIHYLTLYINGKLADIESQSALNLRINNVLFNPTGVTTNTAEYSYSFNLPTTKNNNIIFNYANNLSKINKFHDRYKAEVYADGHLIFDGSLTLEKVVNNYYECHLVNIKINTLEDIFGEQTMTSLHWDIDFDGATTINAINANSKTDYFFPFASYGVFQKEPYFEDEVGGEFTPKSQIDKYNKFWIETFPPSMKALETVRKAYENKGYKVNGNAFTDPILNSIYITPNLANEQPTIYNLGNPKFGHLSLTATWNNYASSSQNPNFENNRNGYFYTTGGWQQDLEFPYERVKPAVNASNKDANEEYNYSAINVWNMLDKKYNAAVSVSLDNPSYMFDPGEQIIVIPADGWYRIKLDVNAQLSGYNTTFAAEQWTTTYYANDEFKEREVLINRDLLGQTPLEIQLIKNYDENIELIKGKNNVEYLTGDPNSPEYIHHEGAGYESFNYILNKVEWLTDFPHQDLKGSTPPTKTDALIPAVIKNRRTIPSGDSGNGTYSGGSRSGGGGGGSFGGGNSSHDPVYGATATNTYGYIHNGMVMPFDPAVTNSFICGFSSMRGATISVEKNGRSWSRLNDTTNKIFANVNGMDLYGKDESGETTITATEYCKNEYKNSANNLTVSGNRLSGTVECCVYLNRNDLLELCAIQRDFNGQCYAVSASTHLEITAISERTEKELRADNDFNFYSATEFPEQLNLFNFQNKETKVSDWITSILTAYNLSATQIGNEIFINKNKANIATNGSAIDIDNRAKSGDAESQRIEYPREMSIQYKINTDEYGFELTVPDEHINDEDWNEWGDSGYTVIKLNDDSYVTNTQNISTNFSYCWYMPFLWKEVLADGTESGNEVNIQLPVIELSEYMAEGYGYEEAMKHDGFSLSQRFWFRQNPSSEYVYLADSMHEQVFLTYPVNVMNDVNISYKTNEKSIATEYFNIQPLLSSNIVQLDIYISPEEHKMIKGGALIKFDSDLYIPIQIDGYDPTGRNLTRITLIKKV